LELEVIISYESSSNKLRIINGDYSNDYLQVNSRSLYKARACALTLLELEVIFSLESSSDKHEIINRDYSIDYLK
jgi:hypothetical protein